MEISSCSSIGPEGNIFVQITMAYITITHPAIIAKYFYHLIPLGNDYMKSIGLVLDLQEGKMWLRDHPEQSYPVSSDLTNAGRIDVPVKSIERRIIAPYHIAYIQVNVSPSLKFNSWDASITRHRSDITTANSLTRFIDRKSFVQIANCSPRRQHLYCGQQVALADLYYDDIDSSLSLDQSSSFLPTVSSSWASSMTLSKEGLLARPSLETFSITIHPIDYQQTIVDESDE